MSIHCKPYKFDIYRLLPAVLAILLGFLYVPEVAADTLSGKPRIALLGDSMTWIGGDSCQNPTGWSHILKESGIASAIDVYARSGATWTNTTATRRNPDHYTELLHDDNVIYNQTVRLIERADTSDTIPDLIILFAGANDAWFADKRPGIFDSNDKEAAYTSSTDPSKVTSLKGSVRLVSDILSARFPDAILLFVTPLQMSKTDKDTIFKVSDIIEMTASEKGHPTLRADKDTGITHDQEALSPVYTSDGVHTNPKGARILGDYMTNFILTSIPTLQLPNN
ncbi:MAG: SGNH/GDSL hydrolase family protein [Muribaculaceae bacterium]|nr:SGNH/GDSL hydrolase family protein [Muribaculaceae bacterium]